jgi:hypothetical protein
MPGPQSASLNQADELVSGCSYFRLKLQPVEFAPTRKQGPLPPRTPQPQISQMLEVLADNEDDKALK